MNNCCNKWNGAAVFSISKCSADLWNSVLFTNVDNPFLIKFCPDCGAKLDDNNIEEIRKYQRTIIDRGLEDFKHECHTDIQEKK